MEKVTVQITVKAPVEKVWNQLNNPLDIMKWNFASPDWHCPAAENDFKVGGTLKSTMAAKDGSFAFDFEAVYDEIIPNKYLKYHLTDGRVVEVQLTEGNEEVVVTQTFDAEQNNPIEMQQQGWQAILNNFKNYVEHN